MKVRFARSATADLGSIGDWIAEGNPPRAATFIREIEARCLSLSKRPNRLPTVGRIAGFPLRKFVFRSYLIFYVVGRDAVDKVRIVHGSRDWAALIGDPEQ